MEAMITNPELVVLGLVAERPKYGYQIEQDIIQRGMREWTEIGFSSIYYILNKLDAEDMLSSEKRIEGDRPVRKIYTLTDAGKRAYRDAVRTRLTAPRPRTGDFDLGLANLLALERSEVLQAFRSYQNTLQERLAHVNAKYELDGGDNLDLPAQELFHHSIALLSAELDWIKHAIERLSK